MDSLPDEMLRSIIERADLESLRSLAQTSQRFHFLVKDHFRRCIRALWSMGIHDIPDHLLLEILNHLNSYNGWSPSGILFDGHKYIKGNNSVSLDDKEWTLNHKLHRINGPATIFRNGNVIVEKWYIEGMLHRTDGPAIIIRNNIELEEHWFINGQRHRTDGPALIVWGSDGCKTTEFWYNNDKVHRTDGPAQFRALKNGGKIEYWYSDGNYHRIDGPAVTMWDGSGNTAVEHWYNNGKWYVQSAY